MPYQGQSWDALGSQTPFSLPSILHSSRCPELIPSFPQTCPPTSAFLVYHLATRSPFFPRLRNRVQFLSPRQLSSVSKIVSISATERIQKSLPILCEECVHLSITST